MCVISGGGGGGWGSQCAGGGRGNGQGGLGKPLTASTPGGVDDVAVCLRAASRRGMSTLMGLGSRGMRRGVSWIGEVGVSGGGLNGGRLMAVRVAESGFTPGGDIEASVMQCGSGVYGVAVSNTTKRRHDLLPAD